MGYNLIKNNRIRINPGLVDEISLAFKDRLDDSILGIDSHLKKLVNNKKKRGVINGLGSIIKFISGNLDNNDLEKINEHIEELKKGQTREIVRLDKLTVLANHITHRLNEETSIINKVLERNQEVINSVVKISERNDLRAILQNELAQSEKLLRFLERVDRTIGLALREIVNLEMFQTDELLKIQTSLEDIYSKTQVPLGTRSHLFEILSLAKVGVVAADEVLTFLLKIPILTPTLYRYNRIYPLPNEDNVIIIPPKRYSLRTQDAELWTDEECIQYSKDFLCSVPPIAQLCSPTTPQRCETASIKNDFKIVTTLRNDELLVAFKTPTEIIEECVEHVKRISIHGAFIVSSSCKIIIGTTVYSKTIPKFEINVPTINAMLLLPNRSIPLLNHHLEAPSLLLEESETLLKYPSIQEDPTRILPLFTIGTIVIMLSACVFLCMKFRIRLRELFLNPRTIVHLATPDEDVPSA